MTVVGFIAGPLAAAGAIVTPTTSSSPSFAGYEVSKTTGKVTEASATFVVPTVSCTKNRSGFGPSVFVQTRVDKRNGLTQSGGGVDLACAKKRATYQAVLTVDGTVATDDSYSVSPGDKIRTIVTMSAAGTQVAVNDVTSGVNKSVSGDGAIGASALIGDSPIGVGTATVGVNPFSRTGFKAARVNNKPVGKAAAVAVQRVDGTTVQIAVSKLTAKKTFTVTFKDSK